MFTECWMAIPHCSLHVRWIYSTRHLSLGALFNLCQLSKKQLAWAPLTRPGYNVRRPPAGLTPRSKKTPRPWGFKDYASEHSGNMPVNIQGTCQWTTREHASEHLGNMSVNIQGTFSEHSKKSLRMFMKCNSILRKKKRIYTVRVSSLLQNSL
jgi:hypothetical protein